MYPPQPYAPHGYGPGPGAPPLPQRSGMAVAALVSGIVGLVTCFMGVTSVLAVVFGLVGARQVKRSGGWLTGLAAARAGWITGLAGIALATTFWVWAVNDDAFADLPGRGMQVGTCLDLDGELIGGGGPAPTVSCDAIHDAEVYEIGWLDPRRTVPYPGAAETLARARAACSGSPFEEYVGVPAIDSALRVDALVPDAGDWHDWRGEYVCFVRRAEGPLTASVYASGR